MKYAPFFIDAYIEGRIGLHTEIGGRSPVGGVARSHLHVMRDVPDVKSELSTSDRIPLHDQRQRQEGQRVRRKYLW